MKTLEEKIRAEAASKIRVRITSRKRSAKGFNVTFAKAADTSTGAGGGYQKHAVTKREALQNLFAVLRCMSPIEISIAPRK